MEHLEYTFSPPPLQNPPPLPPSKNSLSMLYYGLVVVATAAIVLVIYNLVIIKWCANHHRRLRDMEQTVEGLSLSRRRLNNNPITSSSRISLGDSFKYKKEGEECKRLGYDNYECPVCLSVFEEEEEVRQLPTCNHSFHAPCIDMWLYTHLDCPLCRAPVELPVQTPVANIPTTSTDHLREVLIGIS